MLFDKANNLVAEQLGKWKGNKFGYAATKMYSLYYTWELLVQFVCNFVATQVARENCPL